MKFTRMLSALFIAASLVLGMHSAASADQLQDIKARGTLRVAIPQDYPPFGFMGPDKQLKGYDIEMAGIVAKALGVKCELVPVTGANRIPFLLSNRADIVISTLGKTKERQKVIDFSIAYAASYVQSVTFRSFECYIVSTVLYLLLALFMKHVLLALSRLWFRGDI